MSSSALTSVRPGAGAGADAQEDARPMPAASSLAEREAERADAPPASATAHLTPLESALHHQLFTRPQHLSSRAQYLSFWSAQTQTSPQHIPTSPSRSNPNTNTNTNTSSTPKRRRETREKFGRDIVDEEFLRGAIEERVRRVERLGRVLNVRRDVLNGLNDATILSNALAQNSQGSHATDNSVIDPSTNASLSFTPNSHTSMRGLLQARDARALEYLRSLRDLKEAQDERASLRRDIAVIRSQTSTQLTDILSNPVSGRRAARNVAGEEGARIRRMEKALQDVLSKREMVRGVLRGLVLESSIEWGSHEQLSKIMLGMGDEGESSGEEGEEQDVDDALDDRGEDEE
ncbi:Centromere protein H [Ceraceosorus bombacis]|uniref:Centromere protein H n=1 Tax=Ceraceosorus bombacis TaxID=401625 RepID=A0A0P1BBA6_9BASI|nr:Centromere protein H [Ceraceosorus bombacis]